MNPFLLASKTALRFTTNRGSSIGTEDLWSLTLKDLDAMAVQIDSQITPTRKSFLENPDPNSTRANKENELRLEILKAVIEHKQEENKARLQQASIRAQRETLNRLIAEKEAGALADQSLDALRKQLAELG